MPAWRLQSVHTSCRDYVYSLPFGCLLPKWQDFVIAPRNTLSRFRVSSSTELFVLLPNDDHSYGVRAACVAVQGTTLAAAITHESHRAAPRDP